MAVTRTSRSIKMTAQGDSISDMLLVKRLQWISAGSADNDALLVSDSKGAIIWESVAPTTTFSDTVYIEEWINGITVTTMSSGYVVVEYA